MVRVGFAEIAQVFFKILFLFFNQLNTCIALCFFLCITSFSRKIFILYLYSIFIIHSYILYPYSQLPQTISGGFWSQPAPLDNPRVCFPFPLSLSLFLLNSYLPTLPLLSPFFHIIIINIFFVIISFLFIHIK